MFAELVLLVLEQRIPFTLLAVVLVGRQVTTGITEMPITTLSQETS
jgi:hypothetical protein